MPCPRCGLQIQPGVAFCPRCGLQQAVQQQQPPQQPPPPQQPQQPPQPQQYAAPPPWQSPQPGPKRSVGLIVALGLAAGVILALVAALVFVLVGDSGDDTPVAKDTATPSATTSPSESATPTPKPSRTRKPRKVTGPGDVREEPAGLFCRDLEAKGYSYVAAVDYWRSHGQPNQMDADRNGIPCETVFPMSDVEAYWGPQNYVPDTYRGIETLPSGLFCRDLAARGYSYPQAVDYWWYWGSPDRMDEDRNGIPCETVYPSSEVNGFWFW